ncbi:MAG: hypothetical protein K0B87_09105 [Candidatus Syntrophosphaera sp.]|nr:hypothetical protein [Candidatus Syntrophosphaera sp.]
MRCCMNRKIIIVLAVLLAGILALSASGERELVSVILGSGTSYTGTTTGCPINIYYKSLHGQSIYTAAELSAAGITGPALLTQVGFYVNTAPSYALPDFIIRMKHTAAENVAYWQSSNNMVTVYSATSYQPTAGGYEMLSLSEPFLWNGSDNLVIDTAFGLAAGWSATGTVQYTIIEDGYRFTRNDLHDQTNSFAGGMNTDFRPNVRLTFVQGDSAPVISTDSGLLAAELFVNEEGADSLTVFNLGFEDLVYTITESPDAAWFSFHPSAGTVGSGGSELVTGTFSSSGLEPGRYQTSLLFDSNDPHTPQLTVSVELVVLNTPPSLALPDSLTFAMNSQLAVDFFPYVYDPDGQELVLEYSGNTDVLVEINDLMVSFGATPDWHGTEELTFSVFDGYAHAYDTVLVTVNYVNTPPTINLPDSFEFGVEFGLLVDFSPYVFDADGDELTLSYSGNSNVIIHVSGLAVSLSSGHCWSGSELVFFTVSDGYAAASDSVLIIVSCEEQPLSMVLPDSFEFDMDQGLVIDFSAYIDNPGDGPLTLAYSGNTNLIIRISGLLVSISAANGWTGSELITFILSDGVNQTSASVWVIVIPYSLPVPDIQISLLDTETVRIEWNAVASQVYYEIWAGEDPFGTYSLLGVTDNLHWDHPASDSEMLFFRVIATDVPIID